MAAAVLELVLMEMEALDLVCHAPRIYARDLLHS